jgi:acetolactate synthase-1/2/3 large subunit
MTEPNNNNYATSVQDLGKDSNVATVILRYLQLEEVTHIFGIPGGGLKHLLEELRIQKRDDKYIEYVICRQETGAAYMADGYHRVSGKLAVVMVTSGPGATNALTGSMNAEADHSAYLIITGEGPEQFAGMGYLQGGVAGGLKMDAIYRGGVHYSQQITSPDNLHTLMTQALRDSLDLPRHATHLSLPDNVAAMPPPEGFMLPAGSNNYRASNVPRNKPQVKEAFKHLMNAKRPLIFLGNGNRFTLNKDHRLDEFVEFANKFAIPIMTTPDGKGLYPESDDMSLRNYGLAACRWTIDYMQGSGEPYDALLVIGSTLGMLATNAWNPMLIPKGPLIQVDADQGAIARSFPIQLGIVSDAGQAVDELCRLGEETDPPEQVGPRREYIEKMKKENSPYYWESEKRNSDKSIPILPQVMSKIVNEALPEEGCHIFIDGGNCIGWALHHMVIDPPHQMHNSLDMGPMGWGTCAAVGGKIADPSKTVICFTGDGAFMMQGSEVSTASQYKVGVIWIVEYNNDYAMVSQGQAGTFEEPENPPWLDYYKLGAPDLCKYAEGLGADVYRVNTPDEMKASFRTALERSKLQMPQVIVVNIDRSEIPPYFYVENLLQQEES